MALEEFSADTVDARVGSPFFIRPEWMTDEGMTKLSLNPWLRIWFRPRRTMRALIEFDPRYGVVFLASLSGIYRALNQFAKKSFGDITSMSWIVFYAILFGVVFGNLGVQVYGWLLQWVGGWLGGRASKAAARAAVAWASIPDVILLIGFVIIMAVYGESWFRSDLYTTIEANRVLTILAILVPVGTVLLIWRLVLTIINLSEVHQFSILRSIVTLVIASLLIVCPILVLWLGQHYLPILFPQFEKAT